jgi:4-amino-4-deoxy-L-arabinose transferase-like glycosyltransferase
VKKYLLILILLLAAVLRFWRLDSYPALNADEAAIGYNAYSLIQTGKDEHGNPWPIHFQSFGDYKPGLYFYLVLPFVKAFGLNEWTVRIPGATLGVLTVLVVYLLVTELFKNRNLALTAGFLLAISPWHVHFSRGGWEVNASTFFITAGVWLFVKYINTKSFKYLAFCILHFALSLYAYHAARIVVPLLGLGLLVIYRREISKNLKSVLVVGFIGLILLLPLAKDLVGPAGISRAAGVGLFADPGPLNRINEQRGEHANFGSLTAKLFHNKAVNYGLAFLQNWASHFHGEFLFLSGDVIQRNKVPETGQMYLFDILFVAIGLAVLIKNLDKSAKVVLVWLVVAPMASALTFQSPHALRAHNMVIPLIIISAMGMDRIISWLNGSLIKRLRVIGYGLIGILVILSFVRYEHMYWIHMDKEYPFSSQYGLKELVGYISQNEDKYQKIWATDKYDQPYVLFLFYLRYPPKDFQGNHVLTARDKFGFSTVRDFGKFHFEAVNFDKIRPENPNSLIIGAPNEIPKEANIVKRIYGSNGYEYFDIVVN